MATTESYEEDDWQNLSFRIDEIFTHYNNYIFRGQADADWKLESTLDRALKVIYKKPSERRNAAERHFEQFKANIRGRSSIDLNNSAEDEIWSLGQHFGLYTPLLDWTRSPYVGLFFSFFGPCKSGKRAFWAILESDLDEINSIKKSKRSKVYVVDPLTHYNERLVNQRGLFLRIPLGVELENWVNTAKKLGWVTMYKIVFPDSIRNDALSALNNMNINELSLFPDLHGSSLYTNYQLEIEPYLEQERDKLWKELSRSR
jgi:hypothetical protein